MRQLDVLRGIAVLLVLGHHEPILQLLTLGGWCGVDLFFVLSGFLVSGLLFQGYRQNGKLDVPRFLIRRGFKIYPSFWFFLAVTSCVTFYYKGHLAGRDRYFVELFFLQNYLNPLWDHTWSLAVEEHFYFILPLALFYLTVRKRGNADPFRNLPFFFLAIASLVLGLRILNHLHYPYTYPTHHYRTHLRLDSLLFGSLLSYWHHYHQRALHIWVNRRPVLIAAFGILAISPAFLFAQEGFFVNTFGLSLQYLGFGCVLVLALHLDFPPWRFVAWGAGPVLRLLALIGFHSYTIYLWHLFILRYCSRWVGAIAGPNHRYALDVIAYVGLSIMVGIAASKLVETPFLQLRNRLFPKENPQAKSPAG